MQNPMNPALICCVGMLLGVGACGGKNKNENTKLMKDEESATLPKVDPTLCDTEGKRVVTSDLDHDKRPDVWRLYKTIEEGETTVEFLSCRQTDYDHDGRKDHVVAFDKKGAKTFEKFDLDFDGRFDAIFQFDPKTGKLFEVQRETGFDGQYDIQEIYDENEVLKAIKHDRNADGEPDMWEQFVNGSLVAILYDDDYDSKVDRREEAKPKQPKKPTAGNDKASGDEEPKPTDQPDDGATDNGSVSETDAPAADSQ
jgi:hypothetical protein